jgi:hypothetical protein
LVKHPNDRDVADTVSSGVAVDGRQTLRTDRSDGSSEGPQGSFSDMTAAMGS